METQLDLLSYVTPLPPIHFKGESYDVVFDCRRLNGQQQRVFDVTCDQGWFTLQEIQARIMREFSKRDPESSISARLRDLNNNEYLAQFFTMQHRRRGDPKMGLFEYQVTRRHLTEGVG
jgi:hypothetical protein